MNNPCKFPERFNTLKKILQVQSSYHGGLVRLIDNLEPLERVMFHCNCNWIAIEALQRINLAEKNLI